MPCKKTRCTRCFRKRKLQGSLISTGRKDGIRNVYAVVLRRERNVINDIEIFTHDRERNGKGCALAKHLASHYAEILAIHLRLRDIRWTEFSREVAKLEMRKTSCALDERMYALLASLFTPSIIRMHPLKPNFLFPRARPRCRFRVFVLFTCFLFATRFLTRVSLERYFAREYENFIDIYYALYFTGCNQDPR